MGTALALAAATSVTGILTAVGALLGGLGVCLGAIPLLVSMWRTGRATHVIVNQQRTNMQAYQRDLVAQLEADGSKVPRDRSLPPPDEAGERLA